MSNLKRNNRENNVNINNKIKYYKNILIICEK